MESLSGWVDGYGSGCGYGDGYGDGFGYGSGCGSGCGYGYGSGCGCGEGYGDGFGSGFGDGSGSGYGYGSGYGSGCGYGEGYGDGFGSGSGCGYGFGDGSGIKSFNGLAVNHIDGIQTIISVIKGDYAKGFILSSDLTLKPCFVAKHKDTFAHGETLREAVNALRDKLLEDSPLEERIESFMEAFPDGKKEYPATEYSKWHHILTGSCEMGRQEFAKDHGIDIETASFTVPEFIALCEDAYGGESIKELKAAYAGAYRGEEEGVELWQEEA